MLKVYTAQMRYSGDDKLDITVGSGSNNNPFKPTWKIVNEWKNSSQTENDWQRYADQYKQMMRDSYRENKSLWHQLLETDTVTFCCYCTDVDHCHRKLLAEIFEVLGAKYMGERR